MLLGANSFPPELNAKIPHPDRRTQHQMPEQLSKITVSTNKPVLAPPQPKSCTKTRHQDASSSGPQPRPTADTFSLTASQTLDPPHRIRIQPNLTYPNESNFCLPTYCSFCV